MYIAKFTELAEYDILSTLEYITDILNAPKAAENLFYEIYDKIEIIEDNPFLFPLVKDLYLSKKGLRWIGIKNYMIFFKIIEAEKKVSIIRFLYGRRDWQNILKYTSEENIC